MAKPKPLNQLSPAYRRRIEKKLELGYTRSQARGHPGKGQTLVSKTPPPRFTGASNSVPVNLGNTGFVFNSKSSKTTFDKSTGKRIRYSVYDLRDVRNWEKSLDKLFRSPYGRHKRYRLIASFSSPIEEGELTPKYKRGQIVGDHEEWSIGTVYEEVPGKFNVAKIKAESLLGQLTALSVDFRD